MSSPTGELASVIAAWACDERGIPVKSVVHGMVDCYRRAGGVVDQVDMDVFVMHLIGWLNWIALQMDIALGRRPDDPRNSATADSAVSDLLVWTRRIAGLPTLLDVLRAV